MDNCGRLLSAKRVDFVYGDLTVETMFKRLGVDGEINKGAHLLAQNALHLVAAKTPAGQATIDAFNSGLRALKTSGEYDRLLAYTTTGGS